MSVINLISPQSKLSVFHKMAISALIHQQFLFVGSYSLSVKVEFNAAFFCFTLSVLSVCHSFVCVCVWFSAEPNLYYWRPINESELLPPGHK